MSEFQKLLRQAKSQHGQDDHHKYPINQPKDLSSIYKQKLASLPSEIAVTRKPTTSTLITQNTQNTPKSHKSVRYGNVHSDNRSRTQQVNAGGGGKSEFAKSYSADRLLIQRASVKAPPSYKELIRIAKNTKLEGLVIVNRVVETKKEERRDFDLMSSMNNQSINGSASQQSRVLPINSAGQQSRALPINSASQQSRALPINSAGQQIRALPINSQQSRALPINSQQTNRSSPKNQLFNRTSIKSNSRSRKVMPIDLVKLNVKKRDLASIEDILEEKRLKRIEVDGGDFCSKKRGITDDPRLKKSVFRDSDANQGTLKRKSGMMDIADERGRDKGNKYDRPKKTNPSNDIRPKVVDRSQKLYSKSSRGGGDVYAKTSEPKNDYSSIISQMFGYDRSKYGNRDESSDDDMEVGYTSLAREEKKRIGKIEDMEEEE